MTGSAVNNTPTKLSPASSKVDLARKRSRSIWVESSWGGGLPGRRACAQAIHPESPIISSASIVPTTNSSGKLAKRPALAQEMAAQR
jgi:hypothetical protein